MVAYPFIIYYSIRSNIEEEEGSGFFRKVLRKMLIILLRDMGSDIWVVGGVTCWLVATHFSFRRHGTLLTGAGGGRGGAREEGGGEKNY